MIAHNFIFISTFLSQLEEKSVFKFGILCLLNFNFGFLVVAKCIHAACFEGMDVSVIVVSLHEFVIDFH